MKTTTITFIGVSDIIPESLSKLFWRTLSDKPYFTWGGNNHSIVDIDSFVRYGLKTTLDEGVSEGYITKEEAKDLIDKVLSLDVNNVDLEG